MHLNLTATRPYQLSMRRLAPTLLTTALLLSTAVASSARADGQSAANHFFANLERAGVSVSTKLSDVRPEPTPVRGMYMLYSRKGQLITFTNESGTLYGDMHGFKVFESSGLPRPLTPDEKSLLRLEIMRNLDPDKLVKVVHGNGGGRKLLMFSAVDCGYCKKLEGALLKNQSLNTTFYVVPASLQDISQGGLAKMQVVTNIWCAQNNGEAWKNFWAKGAVPQQRSCRLTPASAEEEYGKLRSMLAGAGRTVSGVPTVINEDGLPVVHGPEMTAAEVNTAFGSGFRSLLPTAPAPYWLLSESEASAQQQLLAAQAPVRRGQQQQQHPGKINTKDLLKKLFN